LTECPLGDGTLLEEDGLVELCRRHGHATGEGMLSGMAADLERMAGSLDFPDDASPCLVEFDGPFG
jgi:sigma-B regulation protein RsbU (phosphoserine phosphatase)